MRDVTTVPTAGASSKAASCTRASRATWKAATSIDITPSYRSPPTTVNLSTITPPAPFNCCAIILKIIIAQNNIRPKARHFVTLSTWPCSARTPSSTGPTTRLPKFPKMPPMASGNTVSTRKKPDSSLVVLVELRKRGSELTLLLSLQIYR